MIRIVVRGAVERAAHAWAEELARRLKQHAERSTPAVRVLGPSSAPMARLRGEYRFQVQLHSADGERLREIVRTATADAKSPDGITWTVDVDPLDMM
jgi:primosomal protein N' (replication factor Y)